jgi:membrane protease YdiL (CAAX protease family)
VPALRPAAGAREALIASCVLVLLLGAGKPLATLVPFGADVLFTLVAGYQLYVPLWLVQARGEAPESHAIHVHGLLLGPIAWLRARVVRRARAGRRRMARKRGRFLRATLAHYGRGASFRPGPFFADVGRALLVALITFPPFIVAHHLWWQLLASPGANVLFVPHLPPDLGVLLLKNTLLVALPEEMFYRGFVETRLERLWPTRRFILGVPLGKTVIVASAFFALGHFAGEWNPARFGPFFPAFVFSMLRRKSGSILGPVLYHGMSNAFSTVLWGSTVVTR